MDLASKYNPNMFVKSEEPVHQGDIANDPVIRKEDSAACESSMAPLVANNNYNSSLLNPENGDQIEMFPKSIKRQSIEQDPFRVSIEVPGVPRFLLTFDKSKFYSIK